MKSPEGRIMIQYVLMGVLWLIGSAIAPHAAASGHLGIVVWIGTLVSARIVLVAPHRFAFRRSTRGLSTAWYLFVGEIVLLAIAFVLALDDRGSVAGAWTALAVAIGLEIFVSKMELGAHRRIGTIVPELRCEALDGDWEVTGESWGGANDTFKRALAQTFPRVATVLRAYLVTATYRGERRRVLALRFAFWWSDDDAIRIVHALFGRCFPAGEQLQVIMLDTAGEGTVRAVAAAFYERAQRAGVAPGAREAESGSVSAP